MPVWKEPPKSPWESRLEPLMQSPGKWAQVYVTETRSHASSIVTRLKSGVYKTPEGGWEFRSSGEGNGGAVYARFVSVKANEVPA